jgi:hypothetical protein
MEMRDHVIGFGKKMLSQSESHLVKNWPIYEMYGNVFLNQMKTITMKFMVFPEILYFCGFVLSLYLTIEIFLLHLKYQKDHLQLQKKILVLEEDNKKMKQIWEQKINEEEYRSESNYHKGIRNLQIQHDELFAKMEHTIMQMDQLREKISKDDEWRGRARGYFRANKESIETLQKCLTVQEDVNGGFRNEIRILKGRITKLRTHVDKHIYDEDDEYVEVSE